MKAKFEYVIDWDKVTSLEDVIEILKGMSIKIDINVCSDKLKKYAIKSNQAGEEAN